MLPVAAGNTHSWLTDADEAVDPDVPETEIVEDACVAVDAGTDSPDAVVSRMDVVAGDASEVGAIVVASAVGAGAAIGVGPGAGQSSLASSSVSTQPSSTMYRQQ